MGGWVFGWKVLFSKYIKHIIYKAPNVTIFLKKTIVLNLYHYRNSSRFNENASHWHIASSKPSERPLDGPRCSAQHPQTHEFITATQSGHAAQLLQSTCANLTGFYWSFGLVRIDLPVPLKAACPLERAVMDSIYRSRAWSIRFASSTRESFLFFFTGYLLCWSCPFDLMCAHTGTYWKYGE